MFSFRYQSCYVLCFKNILPDKKQSQQQTRSTVIVHRSFGGLPPSLGIPPDPTREQGGAHGFAVPLRPSLVLSLRNPWDCSASESLASFPCPEGFLKCLLNIARWNSLTGTPLIIFDVFPTTDITTTDGISGLYSVNNLSNPMSSYARYCCVLYQEYERQGQMREGRYGHPLSLSHPIFSVRKY